MCDVICSQQLCSQRSTSQALLTGTLPEADTRHPLPAAAAALDRALQQQRQQQPLQPSLPAAPLQRGFAGLSFVLTSATDNTADGCAAVSCSSLCKTHASAEQSVKLSGCMPILNCTPPVAGPGLCAACRVQPHPGGRSGHHAVQVFQRSEAAGG